MNYGRLQYRMPYKDDDTDDSLSPENPNADFEEMKDEDEEEEEPRAPHQISTAAIRFHPTGEE